MQEVERMYSLDDVKKTDPEIAQAIVDEQERQNSHIELIASENWVSKAVMATMGSVPVSYTHLDVYKRQVWISPAQYWQEARLLPLTWKLSGQICFFPHMRMMCKERWIQALLRE